MVWLIGVICAIGLFCMFPKQVGVVLVIALIGVAIVAYLVLTADQRKANALANEPVDIQGGGDKPGCDNPTHPILVEIKNKSTTKTIKSLGFVIRAFKPGFSGVVGSNYLETDRIIGPGETFTACWGAPYGPVPAGYTYKNLEWRMSKTWVTWQ